MSLLSFTKSFFVRWKFLQFNEFILLKRVHFASNELAFNEYFLEHLQIGHRNILQSLTQRRKSFTIPLEFNSVKNELSSLYGCLLYITQLTEKLERSISLFFKIKIFGLKPKLSSAEIVSKIRENLLLQGTCKHHAFN